MHGVDKIGTDTIGWGIVIFLFFLLAGRIRQFIGWLLMKLYKLFIGSKDPAASV